MWPDRFLADSFIPNSNEFSKFLSFYNIDFRTIDGSRIGVQFSVNNRTANKGPYRNYDILIRLYEYIPTHSLTLSGPTRFTRAEFRQVFPPVDFTLFYRLVAHKAFRRNNGVSLVHNIRTRFYTAVAFLDLTTASDRNRVLLICYKRASLLFQRRMRLSDVRSTRTRRLSQDFQSASSKYECIRYMYLRYVT